MEKLIILYNAEKNSEKKLKNLKNINRKPLNLLFVEDDPQARKSMRVVLNSFFTNIITAVDGRDGFNKFQQNSIDIVITDINMPNQNGISMMKDIRRIDPNIPIIIVTASDEKEYLFDSIKSGVQDYIMKPLVVSELLASIDRVLQKIDNERKKDEILEQYHKTVQPKENLLSLLNRVEESIVLLIKIEDFEYLHNYMDEDIIESMQYEFSEKLLYFIPKEFKFSKIYHLGSGEFVLTKLKSECQFPTDIEFYAKKFQQKVNRAKINVQNLDYDLSIIVSVAYGKSALFDAKVGLNEILESKRDFILANGLQQEVKKLSKRKIDTFKMIRKAIDSSNIVSYFQPIVNNETQKIEKYESLVRLIDDNGEILSPYHFLDVSKKGKYYTQITSIVLENSFKALQKTDTNISINLSTLDIEKIETREKFFSLLQESKEDANRVVLEILEDEDCEDFSIIQKFIKEIKEYGVTIAIDDFGVGYSNFVRVLDFSPDFLKIDGRLVKNINSDKLSYSIVESIVSFAQKEGLKTIAEFVESKEIYDIIRKMGVDYSQGYYFGKPSILK